MLFIVKISDIPLELTDKIFQIKFNPDQTIKKITSYFPLTEYECKMINSVSKQDNFSNFNSIFSDTVTDEEWNKTKEQIKKRFQGHLNDVLKRKNYRKNLLIDRVSNRQPYYGRTAERRALRSVTAQKINDLLTALGQSGRTVIYRANGL